MAIGTFFPLTFGDGRFQSHFIFDNFIWSFSFGQNFASKRKAGFLSPPLNTFVSLMDSKTWHDIYILGLNPFGGGGGGRKIPKF